MCKKHKEGGFSPALAVAASLDCRGESIGVVAFGLCLWAKISTSLWTACSILIENIYITTVG